MLYEIIINTTISIHILCSKIAFMNVASGIPTYIRVGMKWSRRAAARLHCTAQRVHCFASRLTVLWTFEFSMNQSEKRTITSLKWWCNCSYLSLVKWKFQIHINCQATCKLEYTWTHMYAYTCMWCACLRCNVRARIAGCSARFSFWSTSMNGKFICS